MYVKRNDIRKYGRRTTTRWMLSLVATAWAVTANAATLTWNGGVSGDWANGGGGWLNGVSPANWNNATPDAAIFSGTLTLSPTVNAGGITAGDISFTSGNYSFSGGTLTLSSGNIAVGSGITATFNQALGGTAGLTKSGAGTLSLSGNNKNYSGTTTISGGAIIITDTVAGSMGSSSSGNVTLDGGALHGNFSANKNPGYAYTIGAGGGEFRTLGAGRWQMTTANKVSGSGVLTLTLASATRFELATSQSGFSGKWVFDGGGDTNRLVDFTGSGSGHLGTGTGDDLLTISNSPSLLLRGGVILGGGSQGITLGSPLTRFAIAGGAVATVAGKVSGPSGNTLLIFFDNGSSCILSNQNNSWSGGMTLHAHPNGGRLVLGASGVVPDAGTITITPPAIFDLNGYNEIVGGLAGTGTADVRVASASVTLGVGGGDTSSTFSGTLTNSASGSSLQLVKVGTGTFTVSGTGIGHAGGTIISNGTIEINAAGAGRLGASSSASVTLAGGTLQGNFSANTTVNNAITVAAAGGTIRNVGNDSQRWQMADNTISGSGTLTLAFGTQNSRIVMASAQTGFTGKWIIDSANNGNRFVDVNNGSGFGAATGDDAITFQNGGSMLLRHGTLLGSASQGITIGAGGEARIAFAGTSTGTLSGKISGSAGNHLQLYTDATSSAGIISNTANSFLGNLSINGLGVIRLGNAGVIPDAGGMIGIGTTATLDMSGYAETVGGLSSGLGRIDNQFASSTATLSFGGNNQAASFNGLLTNSGASAVLAITKVGTATQVFTTAHGYAGLTTVSAGALRINNAGALGTTAAGTVVQSGGALELLGNITITGEALTLSGTGTGGSGALRNISNNNIWNAAITLNTTAPLTIQSDSGDLKLRGSITQSGSTPPTFQGNGNIFIEAPMNGGLVRGSGSGDVLISNGTTITGDVTVAANATGAFKVEGALVGDVTLNGGQLTGANGSMGDVTLNNGLLSPAANNVNLLNMNSLTLNGGAYQWNITNATGTAGVNWDLLQVSGAVDLSGAGTGAITIRVTCATASLPNFSQASAGSWLLVDAASVSGFSASKFVVNTSAFTPGSDGGSWAVQESGGDLLLAFTPGTPVDLAVASIAASANPVDVAAAFTYTIVITNNGPANAETYYVTNRLGAGVGYVSSSDGGTHSGGEVRWTLSNLAANGSRTLTLQVTAPLLQSVVTNVVTVLPGRPEANPANNSAEFVTAASCPGAPAPFLQNVSSRSLTNNHLTTFTVISTNVDCATPFLQMGAVPPGASFTVVTNEADHRVTGTFNWEPSVAPGFYTVRIFSWNVGSATSSYSLNLFVDDVGEPQSGGIWNSQTNWQITVSDLRAPSSGNATLVWHAVAGATYDVYASSLPLGGGASWGSPLASGVEASGVLATAVVASSGSMRFYQIVPQGMSRTDRGVWGVVRPSIPNGFYLMAPPVVSDRSFADSGNFGQALSQVVPVGAKVHIATDTTPNWLTLVKQSGGTWRTVPLNAEHVTPLSAGQAFYLEGASGVTPVFTGSVRNDGSQTYTLANGFNPIGPSEGRAMPVTSTFSASTMSSPPVANNNEDLADLIVVQHADGTWRRIFRLSNGTWYDVRARDTTAVSLQPGEAAFYLRRGGGSDVSF